MAFSKLLGGRVPDGGKPTDKNTAKDAPAGASPDMSGMDMSGMDMSVNDLGAEFAPPQHPIDIIPAQATGDAPASGGGLSLEPMDYVPAAEEPAAAATAPAAAQSSSMLELDVSGLAPAPVAPKKGKRIGDTLVEKGLITKDQLQVALHQQQKSSKLIGEILVDLDFITADVLTTFLSEATGLQEFNPKKTVIDPEALEIVPKKDAQKFQLIPIAFDRDKNEAKVAMADPQDVVALDRLRQLFPKGCNIITLVGSPVTIAEAIHKVYDVSTSVEAILKELAGDKGAAKKNLDTLSEDEAYSHPIVRLVNALVFNAVKIGASDLHFEPEENFVRLRYRIDGDLVVVNTFHREYWNGICQRLKIMAEMNIADKLSPQDGRFYMNFGGREADFRVSCLPTMHGENIVLRVLDKSSSIVPLDNLGISEHNMKLIAKCQARPEGIVIVTGPTGSGKTTTLYSMLNVINTPDVNIQTLEDPVEYSLGLIRQSQVREGGGFTFGEGVKALLRQDPDIIFIGEVRDHVTAEQALKAAMTGHQVYTSLHTNDSFGAIPRLVDLGIQPSMLAGAIIATFAQRLVRKLCQKCKRSATATAEECQLLGADPQNPPTIYHPVGCPACNNQGYKGRVACVEILYMDEEMDDIIAAGGTKSQMKACARRKGFKSMLDDGIGKIYEGVTSLDAVTKILNFTDRM